jgi:flagellar assembly protein FliH
MTAAVPLHLFLFDRDFGGDAASMCTTPAGTPDAARASEMEQALAEAHAQGFAEGHRSGVAEASAAADHRLAHALDAIQAEVAAFGAEMRQRDVEFSQQSAALAAGICRKFLPSRYQETAADEIAGLLTTLLPRVALMPKVTVRVAETLVVPLAERLSDLARTAGVPGLIETIGDTRIAEGDCRIEWLRGGAVRESAILWREIDALLEEALGAVPGHSPPAVPALDNPLRRASRDV